MAKRMPKRLAADTAVHLLPAFDEYLVSYSDRSAMLAHPGTQRALRSGKTLLIYSNGIFLPIVVSGGQVVGTWKREPRSNNVVIRINSFTKLSKVEKEGVSTAAERYGRFLEMPTVVQWL